MRLSVISKRREQRMRLNGKVAFITGGNAVRYRLLGALAASVSRRAARNARLVLAFNPRAIGLSTRLAYSRSSMCLRPFPQIEYGASARTPSLGNV